MFKMMTPSTEGPWPYRERSTHAEDAPGRRTAWSWLVSGVRSYRAALAEQRRRRRAMAELEGLDDRMLRDIGVSRSEIGRIVRNGRGPRAGSRSGGTT